MDNKMKDIAHIRNWIKGHFLKGTVFGYSFGVVIGFLFGLGVLEAKTWAVVVSIIIALACYFLQEHFEQIEFINTLDTLLFAKVKGGDKR